MKKKKKIKERRENILTLYKETTVNSFMDIAVPFLIQQACIICKIRFAKKKIKK